VKSVHKEGKAAGLNPIELLISPSGWLVFLFWPVVLIVAYVDQQIDLPTTAKEGPVDSLKGKTGVVVVGLKPIGRVEVEGSVYDAITEAGPLEAGTQVVVVGRRLGQLVVERFRSQS
jgi:membrane-bound ClpP family serine protease